jgi:penicillin amidase
MRNWLLALILTAPPILTAVGAADEGIEILRDPWGVPHVFADTEEAGFFGWGYACAEDRRLQMDLARRKGAGRLAEVFGPDWVRSDREARIAGYTAYAGEAFAKLPAEMQVWLRAYAAGVNAWTAANREAVSRRFEPLGADPESWTPADCLLAARAVLSLGTWYPHDLGLGTGGNGHTGRSWRLQQLLTGTHSYGVEDFESLVHRDAVNPLLAALLPVAIKVADEDQVEDAAVRRLVDAVRGWDLRAETLTKFPAVTALRNVLTPYRGSGLNETYGAGMGGVTNLARRLATDFAREGATPRGQRERAYLMRWLQASAQGTPGRGRGAAAADDWTARMRQGVPDAVGQTITIPYQGMTPLQWPKIDPSLDFVSPPLTCLDTGTIWSQPGNFYTQIVDLADVDNSRAMIAPGNCEDRTNPQRTAGIELWVQGSTRPAPLSRARVEQLGGAKASVDARAYEGPVASPSLTVDKPEPTWQFIPAIPPKATENKAPARSRPAAA